MLCKERNSDLMHLTTGKHCLIKRNTDFPQWAGTAEFGIYNDIGTNLCAGAAVGTFGH